MSGSARLVVRAAAVLLPAHSRERYREQWLGELRDAPEVGIRASEIAIGSLAFAATLARPMPGGTRVNAEMLARRSRRAVALSLSAAIVAISQYASVVTPSEPTHTNAYTFIVFAASTFLTAYTVIAPIVALAAVLATRGVARRVRVAVGLLTFASFLPALRGPINEHIPSGIASEFLTPETIVYPTAALLIALAGVALWREYQPLEPGPSPEPRPSRLLYSGLGGLVVAVTNALAFADSIALWASRMPLAFGRAFTNSTRAEFEEWLTLKVRFEDMMSTIFGTWIIVGIAIALAIAASGLSRHSTARRSVALSVGVLCITLVSYGALVNFLQLATSSITPTVPVDVVMLVGRLGLVAVVLIMVGRAPGRKSFESAPDVRQDTLPATSDRLIISTEQ